MSGGSLDYFYITLEEHNGDFGDKELDELVGDLAELFRKREWYLSGDTNIGVWNEARDNFKQKWFTAHGRHVRIEKYLAELAHEIRMSFGMGNYCQTCKHWTENGDSVYGRCAFETCCDNHRCESCAKWEPKELGNNGG